MLTETYDNHPNYAAFNESSKFICMLVSLLAGIFLLSDKRLKSHPGMLYIYVLISQSAYL